MSALQMLKGVAWFEPYMFTDIKNMIHLYPKLPMVSSMFQVKI